MFRILIVTSEPKRLAEFADALAANTDVQLTWAETGGVALAEVKRFAPTAAIIEEELPDIPGIDLVRRILPINAMILTVILSELESEAFHSAAEGLGIVAQLPLQPKSEEATRLLHRLRKLSFTVPTP